MQVVRALILLAVVLAAACDRHPAKEAPARSPAAADERGYVAPPELLRVIARAGGQLELVGSAPPEARVTLATPAGPVGSVVADPGGGWRLVTAPAGEARLLGLSMSNGGRLIQAKGYLFVAPDGVAARLRAGGGSEAFAGQPGALAVTAMDYDQQFAATLSGRAAPGETVRLRVDGVGRGETSADAQGRFVLPLNELTAGAHDFDLAAERGEIHFSTTIDVPASLASAPFRAARQGPGWRVDWLTPGGGEQTTLVFAGGQP